FAERFGGPAERKGGAFRFPVESYLDHQCRTFAETFPAECFLRLSESIDLHAVDPAASRTPATLIAFEGDAIAPPQQVAEVARTIGGPCTLHRVATRYGHD